MSRAEKARLESEELLKSLGVSIDSGRQTRSSRRSGGRVESPKPEPPPTPKRKAATAATPGRRGKKAKVEEDDQTDGTNHVEEASQPDEKKVNQENLDRIKRLCFQMTFSFIFRALHQQKTQKQPKRLPIHRLKCRQPHKMSLNQCNKWRSMIHRLKAHSNQQHRLR